MGFDAALKGAIEWGAVDPAFWNRVPDTEGDDWPLELPDDERSDVSAEAWIAALRAVAGEGAFAERAGGYDVEAWLGEDALRDIGRGVLATLVLAGRHGAKGRVALVANDGSFGYALTLGPRGALRALPARAQLATLRTMGAAPPSTRGRHRLPPPGAAPPIARAVSPGATLATLRALIEKTKRFDRKKRAEAEALFHALERSPEVAAVDELGRWLAHDEDAVASAAANVLLAHADDAHLSVLARELHGRHRIAAVAAAFKRGPAAAFEALSPHLDVLARTPALAVGATARHAVEYLTRVVALESDPNAVRGSAFDFARFRLPTDSYRGEPRWPALLLSASWANDDWLSMPKLLAHAGDALAGAAFVRAIAGVGLARVESQLAYDRPRGVRAALLSAADEPEHAMHASRLRALAVKLP